MAVALAPEVRVGWCQAPEATAAATDAMCSGVASTSAWPMAAPAWSARSLGGGKLEPFDVSGNGSGALKPRFSAALLRSEALSVAASCTKAVLQDWTNACCRLSWVPPSPSIFFARLSSASPIRGNTARRRMNIEITNTTIVQIMIPTLVLIRNEPLEAIGMCAARGMCV